MVKKKKTPSTEQAAFKKNRNITEPKNGTKNPNIFQRKVSKNLLWTSYRVFATEVLQNKLQNTGGNLLMPVVLLKYLLVRDTRGAGLLIYLVHLLSVHVAHKEELVQISAVICAAFFFLRFFLKVTHFCTEACTKISKIWMPENVYNMIDSPTPILWGSSLRVHIHIVVLCRVAVVLGWMGYTG